MPAYSPEDIQRIRDEERDRGRTEGRLIAMEETLHENTQAIGSLWKANNETQKALVESNVNLVNHFKLHEGLDRKIEIAFWRVAWICGGMAAFYAALSIFGKRLGLD